MRKTILFILCLLSASIAWSQVTEDFELWQTNSDPLPPYRWQYPQQWSTSNDVTEFIAPSVLQSSESNGGQYAALLRSLVIFGQFRPGILFYGNADYNFAMLKLIPKGGLPIESRETEIRGWYKYTTDNPETHGLSIANIVRIDPSSGEETLIAQFQHALSPVDEYTSFQYTTDAGIDFNPGTDHLQLLFYSHEEGDIAVASQLWIDDLQIISAVTANAGPDTTLCISIESGLDSILLGQTPPAGGGIGPYTYSWTTNHYYAGNHYTAIDFLNDTTLANPQLINYADSTLTFYLTVTDSQGTESVDSIKINFSRWTILIDNKSCHLELGDSCQLYSSVHGGILPHSYTWSPAEGLSDPNDLNTWAYPTQNTNYTLQITDAIGCTAEDSFEVFVSPTSTTQYESVNRKSYVYPNPVVDRSLLTFSDSQNEKLQLVIYNSLGRIVKEMIGNTESFILDRKDFTAGVYFYKISKGNKQADSGEFVVK